MEKSSPTASLHKEFAENEIGVSLRVCYNCSTCSTICPVALETGGKYNPRTIIQLANMGLEQKLVEELTPNVWDCTMCELCQEECPQNVDLHETFILVKNAAALNNLIPESYVNETQQVYDNGKAVPLQAAIAKRRDQLGLPESHDINAKEIQILMDMTPAKKVLDQQAKLQKASEEEAN